jgi:hypothetical protein
MLLTERRAAFSILGHTALLTQRSSTMPDWDKILPNIFTDTRFHQTGRARFQINIDGARAGIVVAWRTANFDNFALNVEDFEKLLELKRAGKFEAAFVVAATRIKYSGYGNRFVLTYVAHADAEKFSASLTSMPLNGPFGFFWILSEYAFGNRNPDADDVPY